LGNTGLHAEIALSRDGENLAYVISPEFVGENSLFLRSLDRLDAARMSTARRPFFSDDGQRLGVQGGAAGVAPAQPGAMGMGMGMGGGALRTFSLNGGPPQVHTVGGTGRRFGGSWHDDTIVWSQGSAGVAWSGSLYRLSTTSNEIELLLAPEPGKALVAPEFLPSGDSVLFTIRDVDGNAREGSVAVLSLETDEYHELIEDAYDARYAPTGHLVFARSGALWAVAFNAETLKVTGTQTPVVDAVQMDGNFGDASYAFSDDGLLAYVEGGDVGVFSGTDSSLPLRSLAMLEFEGSRQNLSMQPRAIESMAISPDGERVALVIDDAPDEDIYILDDFARAVPRRLTFDQGEDIWPLWSPDGERIVFWSSREGGGLFSKAANGTGQAERLTESAERQRPEAFTPDGSALIFVDGATRAGVTPEGTLYRIPLSGEGVAEPLLGTGAPEPWADLSPDGRWLAYSAGEWEQIEVYVEPYPNPSGSKWQVSTGGFALAPRWLSNDVLFYFDFDARLPMGVTMETEPVFRPDAPAELWRDMREQNGITAGTVVVDFFPDARGMLVAMNITDATETDATTEDSTGAKQTRLIVVENWFEELEALASDSHLR